MLFHVDFYAGVRNGMQSKQAVCIYHTVSIICDFCGICRTRFVLSLVMPFFMLRCKVEMLVLGSGCYYP